MRTILGVFSFAVLVILTAPIFVQAQTTQITSGKFLITNASSYLGRGTSEINTDIFSSVSFFSNNNESFAPFLICPNFSCYSGRTFTTPNSFALISDQQHTYGAIVINGKQQNSYYYGGMNLTRTTFTIPRIQTRKGKMFFTSEFKLTGTFGVCGISPFANGCPTNQVLFYGNISGHGILHITAQINYDSGQNRSYLKIEKLEYIFEP